MKIAIEHTTRYQYASEASYCAQSLRLTPASFDGHRVLDWRTVVEPAGETTPTRDGLGNVIHLVTVTIPHREIVIHAAGTVEVEDRNGVVTGLSDGVPVRVFRRVTPLTRPDRQITDLAAATREMEPIARLHAMMHEIRDRVEYRKGATNSETPAGEALAAGVGVCQDHAHIFIAMARAGGIPARYITGYMLDAEAAAEAHHAWAEAWVEGLGWIGFDVANRICPTDRYVRMAAALDAHGAAPIRGSRRGGDAERLDVAVDVKQQVCGQSQAQTGQSQAQN
jgi:transglutaminase-like putative cysteine protease